MITRRDIGWMAALGALAAGIWIRDRAWALDAAQTLPILIGFVLFVALPWPWTFRRGSSPIARGPLAAALVLAPLGIALESTLALALAWCALLWSWLAPRVAVPDRRALGRLLLLPFLAFPWIANDFPGLGWSFRISAAWATAGILSLSHVPVLREGTRLLVRGFPLSIEPACSGMSGLQAILIGGSALACLRLRRSAWFWPSLCLLPVAAWLANLARVLAAAVLADALPRSEVFRWLGPAHEAAGWCAVLGVFWACASLFRTVERHGSRGPAARVVPDVPTRAVAMEPGERRSAAPRIPLVRRAIATARGVPWLEVILLADGAWAAKSMWWVAGNAGGTWWHAPFERLAPLAFAIWLAPVVLVSGERSMRVRHAWLAGVALAAVAAGQFGDFHLLCQAGLAGLIVSMAPSRAPLVWGAGSLAWLSVLGWVGAHGAFSPAAVAVIRIFVAAAAAAWERWGGLHRERVTLPLAYARAK